MILIIGGGDIAERGIIPIVGGTSISAKECNVCEPLEVEATMERYKPDIVIVTAGISYPINIADSDPEDWADEIETNLIGSYHVAKYAIANGVKTFIFIASVAGLYGKPNHSGYSASKMGVISLVQSLGMEGYNAYAISPGRVDTSMREKDYPGEDVRTRLAPQEVGMVVKNILSGRYNPGDNIIVRKIGFKKYHKVHDGEPWKTYLGVGMPPRI